MADETNPSNGDRYKFTAREFDSELEDLAYYRGRYYAFKLGIFTSEDPLGFGAGDANLYRPMGNDPVNMTDPSGLTGHPPMGPIWTLRDDGAGPPPREQWEALAAFMRDMHLYTMELAFANFDDGGDPEAAEEAAQERAAWRAEAAGLYEETIFNLEEWEEAYNRTWVDDVIDYIVGVAKGFFKAAASTLVGLIRSRSSTCRSNWRGSRST